MAELDALMLPAAITAGLPSGEEISRYLRDYPKQRAIDALRTAVSEGRPVVQPRGGVGDHLAMIALLRQLERTPGLGMLPVTIDSHTRLGHFDVAAETLAANPADLNGYPLVAHGWRRGRELNESVSVPLEVRHGSPDPRVLFATSLAAGFSSFEGGSISYNLPYSKDVPLSRSLQAWRAVDAVCGQLAREGIVIDREMYGSLTGVLVPASIALAITFIEAVAAVRQGVGCISIALPQGGEAHQDVAALRSIHVLARRYLPGTEVFSVFHQHMGVFPRTHRVADALILYGGLIARLGQATKIINKTHDEAYGVPTVAANVHGIATAHMGCSPFLDFVQIDEDRVAEESYWIRREVSEIVDPVLEADDLENEIDASFRRGTLDIPFSASIHARSAVLPARDDSGAIRYLASGGLPFSKASRDHNDARLQTRRHFSDRTLLETITADINYFLEKDPTDPTERTQP